MIPISVSIRDNKKFPVLQGLTPPFKEANKYLEKNNAA